MSSVNWQKIKSASEAKAKIAHNDMEKRLENNHENPHVNKALTCRNLSLDGRDYKAKCDAYDTRVSYCKSNMKRVRSDAVTMIGLNVKLPEGLTHASYDKQAAWCRDCYRVMRDFIGDENIVSATADFDEIHEFYNPDTKQMELSRPEVDVKFVPEFDGKLCAKKWQTKGSMRLLNQRIEDMTQDRYKMPFMTGKGGKGVSTEVLKTQSAKAEAEARQKAVDAREAQLKANEERFGQMTQRYNEAVHNYNRHMDELDEREESVSRREKLLEASQRSLERQRDKLAVREKELSKRELELSEREAELQRKEKRMVTRERRVGLAEYADEVEQGNEQPKSRRGYSLPWE